MSKSEQSNSPTPDDKKDIFADIEALSKTASEITPSERILTSLQVRKPRKDEFVRCHPDLRVTVSIYEDKENRLEYLIGPNALAEVEALVGVRRVMLTLASTYAGEFFAWPVPIPADVRANRWHSTGFQAAEEASRGWVRVKPETNEYAIYRRIVNDAKAPTWPEEVKDASALLRLSFGPGGGGDLIDDPDHEIVKRLRGEI